MTDTNAPVPQAQVARTGYAADFLGIPVQAPTLDASISNDAVLWEGSATIPYTHFSLKDCSKARRFARWVAWNIDGSSIKLISRTYPRPSPRTGGTWAAAQVGNELYGEIPAGSRPYRPTCRPDVGREGPEA